MTSSQFYIFSWAQFGGNLYVSKEIHWKIVKSRFSNNYLSVSGRGQNWADSLKHWHLLPIFWRSLCWTQRNWGRVSFLTQPTRITGRVTLNWSQRFRQSVSNLTDAVSNESGKNRHMLVGQVWSFLTPFLKKARLLLRGIIPRKRNPPARLGCHWVYQGRMKADAHPSAVQT